MCACVCVCVGGHIDLKVNPFFLYTTAQVPSYMFFPLCPTSPLSLRLRPFLQKAFHFFLLDFSALVWAPIAFHSLCPQTLTGQFLHQIPVLVNGAQILACLGHS